MNRLLLITVLLPLTSVCSAQKKVVALPESVTVEPRITYADRDGHKLTLDVYRPKSPARKLPVVVFVHGGGWKNGSSQSARKNAAWLAEDGFAVVAINYRLTNVAQWPAQIDDCYEAVRWVRRSADEYGFDATRVGAWGTSAGAHLAALMGTRRYPDKEEVSSEVQAVCDWFGPTELLTMPPNNVGNGRTEADIAVSNGAKLLGATVRDVPEKARDASALDNVSYSSSPFLIMHGSQDKGVPIEQSARLHSKLTSMGVEATLEVIQGAGHGGKLFQTPDARGYVRSFFTRHLMSNWSQGQGDAGTLTSGELVPNTFSVETNKNIRWKRDLPETGQSAVTVFGNRLFFTTMKQVDADAELGTDIVAWCCNADTGEVIWNRPVKAEHPLRLSGCFSDSSSPPPVTDGRYVVFFNASGRITCFDMDGKEQWSRGKMAVGRSQPFLQDGRIVNSRLVYTRQKYMPEKGHFTHEHKDAPESLWTNLEAIDLETGDPAWSSSCGVNMGCIPSPLSLSRGRKVIFVGRGGGHSPPEKPEGVSMINALDGSTIWTLPLEGYMSTQTYGVFGSHVMIFHKDEHLWVNVESGQIDRRISICNDVTVHGWSKEGYATRKESLPAKGKRSIIQQSNVVVGHYHFFRSYTHPYLGRINLTTGDLEYLQVPVQQRRTPNGETEALFDASQMSKPIPKDRKEWPFGTGTTISFVAWDLNDVANNNGHQVMGDARSQGNGWGHHASAIPTAAGGCVYFPIMSGMVYVVDAKADRFDDSALVSVSDLGPVNRTWTRSCLTFAHGRIYARTIKHLICIEQPAEETD